MDEDQEAILTTDDIVALRENTRFRNFLSEVNLMIDTCRKEVDTIPSNGLSELQGRIRSYKQILGIFEVNSYESGEEQ